MTPTNLFGLSDHLERLSEHGDPLVVLDETVDFEYFRAWLVEGLDYSDGRKGGRPGLVRTNWLEAVRAVS